MESDYSHYHYTNYYRSLDQGGTRHYGFFHPSLQRTEFRLNATIDNRVLKCQLKETFMNTDRASPVESVYRIPLPMNLGVSGLEVASGDRVYKGKISDAVKAAEKYSDNIANGGESVMAAREEDGVFLVSVGNIKPGKKITLTIDIVGEIFQYEDLYHFFFHKSILWSSGETKAFSIDIGVHLDEGIEQVESLSKFEPSITYSPDKHSAKVSIKKFVDDHLLLSFVPNTRANEFETLLEYSKEHKAYALNLSLYPRFEDIPVDQINQRTEYILVLDCSGSMRSAIKFAKDALQILLKSIPYASKFNIYLFGTSFEKLFPSSVIYNDKTLLLAKKYVEKADAFLGGTELSNVFSDILSQPAQAEYPRQIFLLTDGEINNQAKLLSYISGHPYDRIFTIGIGGSVDKNLILNLSQVCRGKHTFINKYSDIEAIVLKFFTQAYQPMIYNIKIEYPPDLQVIQAPSLNRPIYKNERFQSFAYFEADKCCDLSSFPLRIQADGPKGNKLEYSLTIDLAKLPRDSNSLHQIFTMKLAQDNLGTSSPEKEALIRALSKKYSVVTDKTSLLVETESDQVTYNSMISEKILENNRGSWESLVCRSENLQLSSNSLLADANLFKRSSGGLTSSFSSAAGAMLASGAQFLMGLYGGSPSKPKVDDTVLNVPNPVIDSETIPVSEFKTDDRLKEILKLQNANGSWGFDQVSKIIKMNLPSNFPKELTGAYATLYVLTYLLREYGSTVQDHYLLIFSKAKKFYKSILESKSLPDYQEQQLENLIQKELEIK